MMDDRKFYRFLMSIPAAEELDARMLLMRAERYNTADNWGEAGAAYRGMGQKYHDVCEYCYAMEYQIREATKGPA